MIFNKAVAVFMAACLVVAPLRGQDSAEPAPAAASPDEMVFNFQDTDIEAVVKTMSQITGRNFLLDPRVAGKKITVISTQPVSRATAYDIFLSVLKAQGLATVNGPKGVVKILPENDAKYTAEVLNQNDLSNNDRWITQVIPIDRASASQMANLFSPLLDPNAKMLVYAPTNTLVITGPASNIRRVLQVIQKIDQQQKSEVVVLPLQYASAADVVQMISRFPEGQLLKDNQLAVVPDMRTNSLLIQADSPTRLDSLKSLVSKLDVPAKPGGQARVIYLRHADAKQLAEVLKGVLFRPATPGAANVPALQQPSGSDSIFVQADEASNALIISAPDATYNNLRTIVEQLDIPRAQIFVEALIAEVSATKAAQFGVRWFGGEEIEKGVVAGALNFPLMGTPLDAVQSITAPNGLSIGFLGEQITLSDGTIITGLGGLARALEEDGNVNILATPNLLTLDNSEAKILIGQNVPFLTGRFTQNNNGQDPFQTIERRDIGLTLRIKPQISEGGDIKLQIFQESSSVALASAVQAQDIITNKRALETTVTVEDSNTVVLGGLIQDTVTENVNGIPILSKIPILGALFSFRSRRKEKINLMIFLKPKIIHKAQDAVALTQDRYEYMRAQEKKTKMKWSPFIRRFPPPVLPEWEIAPPKSESPTPEPKEEKAGPPADEPQKKE